MTTIASLTDVPWYAWLMLACLALAWLLLNGARRLSVPSSAEALEARLASVLIAGVEVAIFWLALTGRIQ